MVEDGCFDVWGRAWCFNGPVAAAGTVTSSLGHLGQQRPASQASCGVKLGFGGKGPGLALACGTSHGSPIVTRTMSSACLRFLLWFKSVFLSYDHSISRKVGRM
jgi:hypothetical protein